MTVKALAALSWISQYCGNATYLLKADDDAFVNEFAVIKHLRDLECAGYDRRLLMCLVWDRPPVARTGKWAVSLAEFARSRYPNYCCGLGYLLTPDVVELLLSAAAAECRYQTGNPRYDVTRDVTKDSPTFPGTERRLWIDDAYVTGILVESLVGKLRHTNMTSVYCKPDKMAAVYRHATEWYKYVFTQVGDDDGDLYRSTWNALEERSANTTIPSPSVISPGHLADQYIPLSTMLQLARNIT